MKLRLRYFASLRDLAGIEVEDRDSTADDAGALYDEVAAQHRFVMPRARLRVAINGEMVEWSRTLSAGDEVVFLPPVSGG